MPREVDPAWIERRVREIERSYEQMYADLEGEVEARFGVDEEEAAKLIEQAQEEVI